MLNRLGKWVKGLVFPHLTALSNQLDPIVDYEGSRTLQVVPVSLMNQHFIFGAIFTAIVYLLGTNKKVMQISAGIPFM